MSLLVCGDKGGSSTKILCQFTNTQASHSVKTAKSLGIYQGSKESRENIQTAFGPIFAQLDDLRKSYEAGVTVSSQAIDTEVQGESEDMETTESSKFILTLKHENKTIRGLADLLPGCYDESNGYFSAQCENCINHFGKHMYTWTGTDSLSTSRFNICFGGDLMWLSYILGLTGPNGKHFCNDCLVTQQDVAKGNHHSPVILPRYQDSDLRQNIPSS